MEPIGGSDGDQQNGSSIDVERRPEESAAAVFGEDDHPLKGDKGDGSDSGVEFCGGGGQPRRPNQEVLQKGSTLIQDSTTIEGQFSCDSSMLSYCSDENLLNDQKMIGTSEGGGSESSSVCNQPLNKSKPGPVNKKRVNLLGAEKSLNNGNSNKTSSPTIVDNIPANRTKLRASSANRAAPNLLTNERARSREKVAVTTSTLTRTNSIRRPVKPDSLPLASPLTTQKRASTLTRTQSVRTPSTTPNDDGRWPYVRTIGSGTPRSSAAKPISVEPLFIRTKIETVNIDNPSNQSTFDKYATMPRRRRERSADPKASITNGDLLVGNNRSSSISRDQLNKMTSSTNSLKPIPAKLPPQIPSVKEANVTPKPRVTPTRRLTQKVKIYQESASQTAITSQDVENAFAGNPKPVDVTEMERNSIGIQSDIRDKELERLQESVKEMTENEERLHGIILEKSKIVSNMEQQLARERETKLDIQKELQNNSERVLAILESYSGARSDLMESTDSLMILESKLTSDNQLVSEQRDEIRKLGRICLALRRELEGTLGREKKLIIEREAFEQESQELQEFLQNEKTAMKMENEKEKLKCEEVLEKKDKEIERLREECRYLVRFSEQRRQENMGMQAKYGALEMRSKELMVQQNNAVSGASVALSNLGVRLESLVEQLIASYNISEQELEDVVYHNEAYPDSGGSSGDNNSPQEMMISSSASNMPKINDDLSPQRGHSFINVVINAIRNATSMAKNRQQQNVLAKVQEVESFHRKTQEESEDSTDMLDSETEPCCLMMENVLEDVPIPDSHSQNLVSTSVIQRDLGAGLTLNDDEDNSLNNLSQAISNRQQIELQTSQMNRKTMMIMKQSSVGTDLSEDLSHDASIADIPSICDNCTNSQNIVEQVITVDNMITKLLKVLRIIQLDNDNCIQHLVGEKNKLQLNKEDIEEKLKDWEDVNVNLKSQLAEVTQQLLDTGDELAVSKVDLQNCRQEIEKLNHHICELSLLCSNDRYDNKRTEDIISELLKKIKGHNMMTSHDGIENELLTLIISTCQDKKFFEMNNNTQKWQYNAISDLKRLYEAIDRALEILNTNQTIVQQYPELLKLQQDLEETNFTLATTLPSYTAIIQRDLNANPTQDADAIETNKNTTNGSNNNNGSPVIDSMA